jgi:arylsulfatase A-like enzyme
MTETVSKSRYSRKRVVVILAVITTLLAAGTWLAINYAIYIPRMIANYKDPIADSKAVVWESGSTPQRLSGEDKRPNIVLIMVDDLGFNGLSYRPPSQETTPRMGGLVDTPNINSIAETGINFDQAYTASGTCAPSRAGLMTGRFPTRSGFEFIPGPAIAARIMEYGYTVDGRSFNPVRHSAPDGTIADHKALGMPLGETLWPELLQQAGYRTLMLGKWHLGATPELQPHNRGFHEFVGFMPGQAHFFMAGDPKMVEAPVGK